MELLAAREIRFNGARIMRSMIKDQLIFYMSNQQNYISKHIWYKVLTFTLLYV